MKRGPLAELCDEYRARLPWPLELREAEERRPLAGAERKAREAALLRATLPEGAFTVALDERGEALGSDGLAGRLEGWRGRGNGTIAFVIGGADGIDATLLAAAKARLSLGAMTWPHMLVRVMLLEQLYRAHSILSGHPYHRA